MARTARALAARDLVQRTLVALAVFAGLLGALAAFGANPAHAVTTFTVNSTGDSADGVTDGLCDVDPGTGGDQCTLRAAIQEANTTTDADTINFAISGNGPHVISPSPALPQITETVIIDGYSQGDATATTADDAKENTIPLAHDGTNAVIKIEINGANAGQFGYGLQIGGSASNVMIRGLAITGFGGSSRGIEIQSGSGTGHVIEGNFIGTKADGTTALANTNGLISGTGNNSTIGGDAPGERNLISGNTFNGVSMNTSDNTVEGNIIGLDRNGAPLANGANGVNVQAGGTGNSILDNAISSNGGLGIAIDGTVPPNDPKDPDTGSNNKQNFPVISSAVRSADGTTTIKGSLGSTPRKVFTIQFFSNPSATGAEGKEFLGELNVRTGRKGTVSFNFITTEDVAAGEAITATATAFSTGDTSVFSAGRPVV